MTLHKRPGQVDAFERIRQYEQVMELLATNAQVPPELAEVAERVPRYEQWLEDEEA